MDLNKLMPDLVGLEALNLPPEQVPNYIRTAALEIVNNVHPPKSKQSGFFAVIAAAFVAADIMGRAVGEPEAASRAFLKDIMAKTPHEQCPDYPNCPCGLLDSAPPIDKSKLN